MVATNGTTDDGASYENVVTSLPDPFDPAVVDTAPEDDMPVLDLDLPSLTDTTWLRLIANALDPDAPVMDADLIPDMSALPADDEFLTEFGDDGDDAGDDLDQLVDLDSPADDASDHPGEAGDWHHGAEHGAEHGGGPDGTHHDLIVDTPDQDDDGGWLS